MKRPRPSCGPIQLSVVIPVFNEENTVERLVHRVLAAPYHKQILIVNDGSTDETASRLARVCRTEEIEIFTHPRNRGKGASIRTALPHCRGRFTIIQDADLEYDPAEYPRLIEPLARGEARVVYGSRYANHENELPVTCFWVGFKVLNVIVQLLLGATLTDEATRYKAFETELLKSLNLQCERFEFCPEVTAKVLMRGHEILEVPISYRYRTTTEGKKSGGETVLKRFGHL